MKAAIDAGHGKLDGRYRGAQANGIVEDILAFDIATRIGHHLRLLGVQTAMTRPGAACVGLVERASTALRQECDMFLSVHLNAGPASAHGAEAFVFDGDSRSAKLAARLLEAVKPCGFAVRGVKPASASQHKGGLTVLTRTHKAMPAVLLEVGFLTNPSDAKLLSDRHVRERVAGEIAKAIAKS